MLENRKIKLQSKTIRRLHEDNIRLASENKELKEKIREYGRLVGAAEKYRDEHVKALEALGNAKEKYYEAARRLKGK